MTTETENRLRDTERRLSTAERRIEMLENFLRDFIKRESQRTGEDYSIARHELGAPTDTTQRFELIERILSDYLEKEHVSASNASSDANRLGRPDL